MLISPTGTDPDRTNPQAFCFTSTMRPTAERTSLRTLREHVSEETSETVSSGFKDLFSFDFLFLKLCRPCYPGISSWSSILIGELPILPIVAHLGALASILYIKHNPLFIKILCLNC